MLNWALKAILDPRVAVVIFLAYCIGYLVFLDEENAFYGSFLQFGPSSTTKFMGIPIDTWSKCLTMYGISFASGIMSAYYGTSLSANFDQRLQDPDLELPFGRGMTMTIKTMDEVISFFVTIISILMITSQQVQFMLPELLANILMGLLETHYLLDSKGS